MSIKKIRLDNLASFRQFGIEDDLKKTCLIYGVNGAGKSTLSQLLAVVDRNRRKPSATTEANVKRYLKDRQSRESPTAELTLAVDFDRGSELLTYYPDSDRLMLRGSGWTPVAVFNEEYTYRTIGASINMDLKSGITIGQADIELEKLKKTRDGLVVEQTQRLQNIDAQAETAGQNYHEIGASTAKTQDVINRQAMLLDVCPYSESPASVEQRKKLGYGKVQDRIELLDATQVSLRFGSQKYEKSCVEKIAPPGIDSETERLLTDYTRFFTLGVEAFDKTRIDACPFCRREWPEGPEVVSRYKQFLQSDFNQRRDEIAECKNYLEQYKAQIIAQVSVVQAKYDQVLQLAPKYEVNSTGWRPLSYNQQRHDEVVGLLDRKYEDMTTTVSLKDLLAGLEASHASCINTDNIIIREIIGAIDAISASRAAVNVELMKHYAACAWRDSRADREALKVIEARLVDVEQRIVQAEESAPPSDTIRAVFNGLMEFMTVQDYSLDENRKLQIRLDKDYDISGQGVRISSAQRKLLSLCYFFAEMVSDVKHPKDLKAYTLVFDDPVDSADYVYFFSIATLIEKYESILSKILAYPKLKIGQTIVLTHNSLIFERLAARWAEDVYRLQKEGNVSTLSRGQRAINNYREYIIDICKYYRNPVSQKRRMIYVGNLIRRVLEILSSFDTLGRADIQQLLDGMGKPRLALIAYHLSHESFTRVLNPIGSSEELRQACRDLLDVIKERHRWQYETIAKDILKDEEGEETL